MDRITLNQSNDNFEPRHSEIERERQMVKDHMDMFYESIGNVSRNLRKGDWTYLQRHPEIRAIIRVIAMEAIRDKPTNIYKFVSDLFDCSNNKILIPKINKQLQWLNEELKGSNWSPAEGDEPFSVSSDVSLSSFAEKKEECVQNNRKSPQTPTYMDNNKKCAEDKQQEQECPENYNFKPTC